MWQVNEIEKPEYKDVLVLPRKTYKPGLKTQRPNFGIYWLVTNFSLSRSCFLSEPPLRRKGAIFISCSLSQKRNEAIASWPSTFKIPWVISSLYVGSNEAAAGYLCPSQTL